jgi:hypothetical protein
MVVVVSVCASAAGGLLAVGAGVVPLALGTLPRVNPTINAFGGFRGPIWDYIYTNYK